MGNRYRQYQIEGAVAEAGWTASIWDTFSHTSNKVKQSQTGDVTCDHYHRYKEDVELMRNLGAQAYRFSISWPRLLPEGQGKPNQRGFDFCDRLIDELLTAGITPFVTLFHWDLPQVLQYPCPPMYITENGAYFDDVLSEDGKVHNARRIDFLAGYINAMLEARLRGVEIRGYFVWSLLDNFEWACGYRPTFGLVKVDFNTLKRISKDSFYWYRDFIKDHP